MIYVLVYPRFEPRCARLLADFRASHEPDRARLVPPHITLVFGVEHAQLDDVAALVERAASQTNRFTVSFESHTVEFDPFEKTYKIFLLCGRGRGQMTALHRQLYAGSHRANLSPDHPFLPHMTIASNDCLDDLKGIDVRQTLSLPFDADIDALQVVQFEDGKLTKLGTVSLNTG